MRFQQAPCRLPIALDKQAASEVKYVSSYSWLYYIEVKCRSALFNQLRLGVVKNNVLLAANATLFAAGASCILHIVVLKLNFSGELNRKLPPSPSRTGPT